MIWCLMARSRLPSVHLADRSNRFAQVARPEYAASRTRREPEGGGTIVAKEAVLTPQGEDFPQWYQDVVARAELAETGPARGSMVIRPWAYAIWELMQADMDRRIKATGVQNAYFPLFIPMSFLEKEKDHVEGFSPERAGVTQGGGEPLAEPLVVRPTSETVINHLFAKWIQSHRDLPLLINQWANVVRWELRPRLFLRTTEFLWQEGHTAHETEDEAMAEALRILHDVYADTAEQVLAVPVLRGRKSASERFPGAVETFAIEALMRDGKALQAGTSHYLGQNFARAYNVRFTDRSGKEQYAYATSWGASTRLVGGLIMAHGDDSGLRLPPAVAPYQIAIVPISSVDSGWTRMREASEGLATTLRAAGLRVSLDDREEIRPGFKFNEWELRGVPLRLELGERELDDGQATLVRRDTGAKERTSTDGIASRTRELLVEIQRRLLEEAHAFRAEHTLENPKSYEVMREFLEAAGGLAIAPWCGSPPPGDRGQK